ncbi:MAG TPA: V-type ATP synthase subunit E family protein [Patescibacteria group bacterium]|nr:V-type ATP synthase subunit E family protein [Patescibacteria group bacterium]
MSSKPLDLETQLIERIIKQRNNQIAKAEKNANKITKSAEEEVERIKKESEAQVLSLIGSDLRAVRDRIVGSAELEGRKMMMLSRQELLSQVFDESMKRLTKVAEGKDKVIDYKGVLVKLIIETASGIGGEEFIISANKRDLAYLKKNLKSIQKQVSDTVGGGEIKFDDEPIDVIGGIVMRNSDGSKTFHNTLEGRLVNVRGRLQADVGKILEVI